MDALTGLGVDTVYTDEPMQSSLDNSISIIGADISQSQLNITGQGVGVCLIDTGVDFSLPSLNGMAVSGYDFVNNNDNASDDNGHGTLMASEIHAVAPNATIIAVKVLGANGAGFSSNAIAG